MACPACMRRGLLLRRLAPRIDKAVDRGAGRRARDLLALDNATLCAAVGVDPDEADGGDEAVAELGRELEATDCWAACPHDAGWPEALARLEDAAPAAIFGRGAVSRLRELRGPPAVTIIGARRAGAYGLEVAARLAEELAGSGVTVVSGMAFGADTAAHEGALRGGATVAILGSGPERAYPRSRGRLYREIVSRGLVLSELPPRSPTFRWTFPARNRLMAALAEVTIVVEAAERSGSLITTEMAADCGRVVAAVPGPINSWRSSGTNRLLADGAALIRGAEDVLDLLYGPGAAPARPAGPPLAGQDGVVLDAIEAGAGSADQISAESGFGPGEVLAAMGRLEAAGYVNVAFGGGLVRTGLTRG